MVSFFRRKKPDAAVAPATDTAPGSRYDIETLAAAFPAAPAQAREIPASPTAADHFAGHDSPADTTGSVDADRGDATAPPGVAGTTAAPADAGSKGWRDRLRGSGFARSVGGLFARNPKLDDDLLDEIETALLTADVGVTATTQLVESLRKRMKAREFAVAGALLAPLRAEVVALLAPGGVFYNLEHVASPTPELHEAFFAALGMTLADEDESNQLLDVTTQVAWLREIGFAQVDCFWKWRELAVFGGAKP
jgi:fused signal recognition particle receptor